ncbi:hypothetical protein [Streptomyces axinellae]|uniref:Uncharacterized protein n=1 Tax=Streptomyces axinellae TaxID=552788 RepID=A0ABN3QMP9_9ACTN
MKTLTLGRWTAELYGRALHIYRLPKRNCRDCHGEGAAPVVAEGPSFEVEYDLCGCWNPDRSIRIPLAPRSRRETGVPF